MSPFLKKSLLSATCLVATSLSSLAQSAPEGNRRRPAPTPSREPMQVRLAEVISMLEEEDLSPEQRARALAKLAEIRDRLLNENDSSRGATPVPTTSPEEGQRRRARFRVGDRARVVETVPVETPIEVPLVVEFPRAAEPPTPMEPAEPVEPAEPMEPAEVPVPAVPPAPATAPSAPTPLLRSLFSRRKVEADEDARIAKVRAGAARVDVERLMAKRMPTKAEFDEFRTNSDLNVVELDGLHRALALRGAAASEAKVEFERAMADHARAMAGQGRALADQDRAIVEEERAMAEEQRALADHSRAMEEHDRAMVEHGANVARAEHFDVVVRSKSRSGDADGNDTAELRAMIDDMREEMREIRALLRELRTKSGRADDARRNAGAAAPQLRGGLRGAVGRGASRGIGVQSGVAPMTTDEAPIGVVDTANAASPLEAAPGVGVGVAPLPARAGVGGPDAAAGAASSSPVNGSSGVGGARALAPAAPLHGAVGPNSSSSSSGTR